MEFNLFRNIKTKYLYVKIIAATLLSVPVLVFFGTHGVNLNKDIEELWSVILTLIWFIIVVRFLKKNNIKFSSFIGKPIKNFVLEVPASFLLIYAGGIGALLVIYFIVYTINPNILNSVQAAMSDSPAEHFSKSGMIYMFMGSVIAAPVTEEFIFRGILLDRLKNKYNIHIAIFVSSLIFMVVHFNPNPIRFLVGISSCILVYKYKSLIPSILLHALNNFMALLSTLYNSSSNSNSDNFYPNVGVCVLGVVLVTIYVIYIYKNYPRKASL